MKRFLCSAMMVALGFIVFSQVPAAVTDTSRLEYSSGSTFYQVERSNWSKYINGKYIGLTHRETRSAVSCTGQTRKGIHFTGFFYVLEETLKDMSTSAQGLDETVNSDFFINERGRMTFSHDEGLPQLRDFPVFPESPVRNGDRWQGEGARSVDPKNDGHRTLLPILVEYTLVGTETYHGVDVLRLRAKYATRLDTYRKTKNDDPSLSGATGTHDVDILVEKDTGATLLILDHLDETFSYLDGSTIRFKGNTAIFTDYPAAIDRDQFIRDSTKIAGGTPEKTNEAARPADSAPPMAPTPTQADNAVAARDANGGAKAIAAAPDPAASGKTAEAAFAVEDTPHGVRLSARDLRFVADSDAVVSEEAGRIDAIAKALLLVKDGHFLVEGHTASVGKNEGEQKLSVMRAKKIVDELVKRGLRADQFIYAGYGGTRPIGDNSTAAGKAMNRRVEITILE